MTPTETGKPEKVISADIDDRQPIPPPRVSFGERFAQISVPIAMLALMIAVWHFYVTINQVPHYILPSPLLVFQSLVNDWPVLFKALQVTVAITFSALAVALIIGVAVAILMSHWRLAELAIFPYAVILQVTPIVAVAPLIIIYAPTTNIALMICAFLVAFFPILSNTTQGLKSTDHNLLSLFELYGASRLQTLVLLKIPNALPYFLAGLRIAGGLALIGAVVAEFVAGSAGADSGLAFRLLESQFRLLIPRLFAALLLLSLTGVVIFFATSLISHLLLRKWHESAVTREN